MIRPVNFKRSTSSSFLSLLQMEDSKVGIEILNLEWVVLPHGNNKLAIPLEATDNTIFLLA